MIDDYEKYLLKNKNATVEGHKSDNRIFIAHIKKSGYGFWITNIPERDKHSWKIRSLQEIIDWLESCKAKIINHKG